MLLVTTSWDDGHPSDLRVADLLDKHGLTGTFYVPCANSENRPVMVSTDIAEVGRRFEVGGHTQDHISLTEVAPHLAANQILGNKRRLEDLLGREVSGFAYVRGRHNRIVRSLVGEAGYRYARTGKNLTSTPGLDRFQVPTTVQFFAHSRSIYLRNWVRRGPTLGRAAILSAVLGHDDLVTRVLRAARASARLGGYFHLWGHSWELDEHGLWNELDRLLAQLRELDARFVTNAAWCAHLWMNAEMRAPPAAKRHADLTDTCLAKSDLVESS
jgi:peptidoglycan/xylan/chitin deacetylase (PgdA/CDA1 family)